MFGVRSDGRPVTITSSGPISECLANCLIAAIIDAPRQLVVGDARNRLLAYALAILVYLVPLFKIRNRPQLLLWWLWTVGTIGVIVLVDVIRGSQLVSLSRYVFLASPGTYIVVSASFDRGLERLAPLAVFLAAAMFGVARWQTGPDISQSTSVVAHLIREKVGPNDGVIITGHFDSEPAFRYFIIAHYAGDWRNPVVLLPERADARLNRELASLPRIWVVAYDSADMRLLPGWRITEFRGIAPGYCLFAIARSGG